jgi:Protein of unknown function (DUF2934)
VKNASGIYRTKGLSARPSRGPGIVGKKRVGELNSKRAMVMNGSGGMIQPQRPRPGVERECLPMRELTECLLQAYDCVARRAYEKFIERDGTPGGDLDDWLNAERELLPSIPVNIEDAREFVYALAAVPRRGGRISVAVESRWLVILSHTEESDSRDRFSRGHDDGRDMPMTHGQTLLAEAAETGVRLFRKCVALDRACAQEEARNGGCWRPGGEPRRDLTVDAPTVMAGETEATAVFRREPGRSALTRATEFDAARYADGEWGTRRTTVGKVCGNGHADHHMAGDMAGAAGDNRFEIDSAIKDAMNAARTESVDMLPAQSVCVLELPHEVDGERSIAVLSNGLLGIRMPKIAN